ncbi:MAG TPA: malto-oligosyltrehalose synthase, partial [Deltaproteobacteria bacterium]|nr:malto-oligosyltrehalose synthase [Deltaproteobacteria bacterium]
AEWPIAGTTGYEFLNLAGGLFVDPEGEDMLTQVYEDFTGEGADWHNLVHECKRHVLTELLGSELTRLTSLFVAVCEKHRRHRDYTRHELYEALLETAVCFPVYRSYVSARRNTVSHQDEQHIARAIESAGARQAELDPELFVFLKELLQLNVAGPLENELAMRFQQLTGPAMAKGVEDTALYRFHRLAALNEVGGNPVRFGVSLEQFHEDCAAAQAEHPLALLASTTHDTKRSEDVRSRLAVLSEIPGLWREAVIKWSKNNEQYRRGDIPERNTEYLLYQTLVGAWPIDEQRMAVYMEKAVREAKINTSWIMQNQDYERGLEGFIKAVLKDESFRAQIEGFVAEILAPGRINSLAQTLMKLTAPGVPDIYQGCELWDLSLVDPDNRRAVDFTLRRRLLQELKDCSPEDILAGMDEGLPKLWVIVKALHLRRSRPELFGPEGSYTALYAQGTKAGHAVAFVRGEGAVCVVPRLVVSLDGDWADTKLELPCGYWHNIFTGDDTAGGPILLSEILKRFPVALFEKRR